MTRGWHSTRHRVFERLCVRVKPDVWLDGSRCRSRLRRLRRELRVVLPELIRKFGVSVDIVAGRAAGKLKTAGGLAAWLRG
jgi:hypothetical protein